MARVRDDSLTGPQADGWIEKFMWASRGLMTAGRATPTSRFAVHRGT